MNYHGFIRASLVLCLSGVAFGCSQNSAENATDKQLFPQRLIAFAPEGKLDANIRRTEFGVPHIEANNLESLSFGSGYAQAEDHLCQLAESYVRVNSERAKYFGPHRNLDYSTGTVRVEDNYNVISDFGYKAVGLKQKAAVNFPTLSDNSKAMLQGFASGYNRFLLDANEGSAKIPEPCNDAQWVKPITASDVLANLYNTNILAGSRNFFEMMFFATPYGDDTYLPRQTTLVNKTHDTARVFDESLIAMAASVGSPDLAELGLGSNGWALGKDSTENGRGMLLANPHFPFFGPLRFWQNHIRIPGVLDVMGASLLGFPGPVNIGFNEGLAWTHTFSAAEHFVVYQLSLQKGNKLVQLVDGKASNIEKRTFTIDVLMDGDLVKFEKDMWFSTSGPMVQSHEKGNPFVWSEKHAFAIKDVDVDNNDILDHWLSMNMSTEMDEFVNTFKEYDGLMFVNTLVTDNKGEAFYIDDSNVPDLSEEALAALRNSETLQKYRQQAGFTILPGNKSEFIFSKKVPFERAPQLTRTDFVQNSNDSHWATNIHARLEGYSPLYGGERNELSLRTRMGLRLLEESGGGDNKYSLADLESDLFSYRAYLPELIMKDLLLQCEAQGKTPVVIDTQKVDISAGCHALNQWDGRQGSESVAGPLIREISDNFSNRKHLTVPFDPDNAANTPHTLTQDGSALKLIAHAMVNLQSAGFDYDATLGELQFMESPLVYSEAESRRISWPGTHNWVGGFNVFAVENESDFDTVLPLTFYPGVKNLKSGETLDTGLSDQGYQIGFGSSWMMLVSYSDKGPSARGLLTYSQSMDPTSPHYDDQSLYYSRENMLRPLHYAELDIQRHLLTSKQITWETAR